MAERQSFVDTQQGGPEGDDGAADSAAVEARAKEMGWIPKEQFRGDESKWIDAASYVERGETLLPIVRADKKRLEGQVGTLNSELASTKGQLAAALESIEELKQFNADMTLNRAKQRKTEIATEIRQAREDNNVEREQELLDELSEANNVIKQNGTRPAPKQQNGNGAAPKTAPPQIDPQWAQENPWFGRDQDRTDLAVVVGQRLRRTPETATLAGKAFLDKVSEEVERIMPTQSHRNNHDRVDGGRGSLTSGGGGGGPPGKGYADLPKEAKEACERQGRRLVGEGRAFKDQASWRAHYAKVYFE